MPTALTNGGRLHDQAAQFGAALEAREDAAALQMLAAWSDSYWAIRKDLDTLLQQVEAAKLAGVRVSPSWLTRQQRYRNLLKTAKREMVKYANAASGSITAQQRSALQAALKDAQRLTKTALGENVGQVAADLLDINPANVDAAVGYLQDGSVLSQHLRQTLANNAPDILRQVLTQGLGRGLSQDRMVGMLTKALSTTHARAVTILRTESLRAYRGATLASFQANSHVVSTWVWRCALDPRSCMACVMMNGTEHPLTESLDGHPRCRCAMIPKTKTWAELGVPGVEETQVQVETGESWFRRQTPTTQRAMMGPRKFDAWQGGEFDLPDLVARSHDPDWGTMRYEASLKSIRANRVPNTPSPEPTVPSPEPPPKVPEPAPELPPVPSYRRPDDPFKAMTARDPHYDLRYADDARLASVSDLATDPERRRLAQAELRYREHLAKDLPPNLPPSKHTVRELHQLQVDLRDRPDDVVQVNAVKQKDAAARAIAQAEMERRIALDPAKYATPESALADRLPRQKDWTPTSNPRSAQAYADMDAVNPNWRSGDRGWDVNCTNCTATYELRRRGFDVTAAKRPGGSRARGRSMYESANAWGIPTIKVLETSGQTWLQMERAVKALPEGARGAVSMTWKGGGGHIFNWEVHDGEVVFIDSQAVHDKTPAMAERHYTLAWLRSHAQNKITGWFRLDDAELTDALGDFIHHAPGHPWV